MAEVWLRKTGGPSVWACCGIPVGLGKGRSSKEWAILRALLRQILADWWLLKGKLLLLGMLGTLLLLLVDTVPATLALLGDGVARMVGAGPSVVEDDGERPAEVGAVLPVGVGRLNELERLLQGQVGHCRGSSALSAKLRDWRSQCLRENTGISKKAQ